MTLLASYPTPNGGKIGLHYHGGRFQTEHSHASGGAGLVDQDTLRARDHYELAEREGYVLAPFPVGFRRVVPVGQLPAVTP